MTTDIGYCPIIIITKSITRNKLNFLKDFTKLILGLGASCFLSCLTINGFFSYLSDHLEITFTLRLDASFSNYSNFN